MGCKLFLEPAGGIKADTLWSQIGIRQQGKRRCAQDNVFPPKMIKQKRKEKEPLVDTLEPAAERGHVARPSGRERTDLSGPLLAFSAGRLDESWESEPLPASIAWREV